ncbi:MAG: hypothetical protein JO063_14920 [Pseudonocardiales bacterium]|nr:hypothetical protein [Pseudonocardiales bacterium]MBV9031746.1 hypothetical protein [Pseudonocardiales bacterium]MBW0011377.1 hypothetical protein [Pseudonocardiales bacterium]
MVPYEGLYGDVEPHVTVTMGASEEAAVTIERKVTAALSISAELREAWLVAFDGLWRVRGRFEFGTGNWTTRPGTSQLVTGECAGYLGEPAKFAAQAVGLGDDVPSGEYPQCGRSCRRQRRAARMSAASRGRDPVRRAGGGPRPRSPPPQNDSPSAVMPDQHKSVDRCFIGAFYRGGLNVRTTCGKQPECHQRGLSTRSVPNSVLITMGRLSL